MPTNFHKMADDALDYNINQIYEAVSSPNLWKQCLEGVASVINAKSAMLGLDDAKTQCNLTSLRYGMAHDAIAEMQAFRDKDPWVKCLLNIDTNRFLFNEQFLPQKYYFASEFFNDFGQRHDIYHTAAIYLKREHNQALRLSFQRGKSQHAYGTKETEYLNRLLPHFKHAVSLSARFFESPLTTSYLSPIKNSEDAIFILDSHCRLQYLNMLAENMLKQSHIVQFQNNHLRFKCPPANAIKTTIRSVTRADQIINMPPSNAFIINVDESNTNKTYLIEVNRFSNHREQMTENLLPQTAHFSRPNVRLNKNYAILTIKQLFHTLDTTKKRLKQLFNLTNTEVEIACLIANGLSSSDIAKRRSRSIETIRTQLKQIILKMNVKSVNQLIVRVNDLSR